MEQKASSLRQDLLEKSLYICSMDTHGLLWDISCRYSIQEIKMSDLFSFSQAPFTIMFDQATTIKLIKPMIEDEDENHALQEIDFLDGGGVPYEMGFGVFRSQIVLAGGCQYPIELYSNRVYVLDNKRKQVNIPFLQSPKGLPKLMEIKGKFYALDLWFQLVFCEEGSSYYCFEVFDPNFGSWVSLPNPPPRIMQGCSDILSYLVAGTKIFIANYQTPAYCFDVECPTQKWEEVPVRYSSCLPSGWDENRQLSKWPSIDLDLGNHMLVVYMIFERLHFVRFMVRNNGTVLLQYVATIEVGVEFHHSTCLTYLGGETICCVFADPFRGLKVRGVIFTFKISFSRSVDAAGSAVITPVSSCTDDDPYFKIIYPSNSLGNSFSAKALGWRTFEYQFPETALSTLKFSEVIGLAALPQHHNGHAFCKVCGSYFLNTEDLNKHLSTNKSCRTELLPLAKCKFCHVYFPKRELLDHFNTSLSCKSKFTEDGGGQVDKCFSPS